MVVQITIKILSCTAISLYAFIQIHLYAKIHETQSQPFQIQALPGPCFGPNVSRDTTEIILLWGLFHDIAGLPRWC